MLGSAPPKTSTPKKAILDSGCTGHFFSIKAPLINRRPTKRPLRVNLPDHDIMESTHEGELPIPTLPQEARRAHQFPALQDTSLCSVGQLCDAGCTATFTAETATVYHKERVILEGTRNPETQGLWTFTIPEPHKAFNAISASAKPADLVTFAHAALWSPAVSTLAKALAKGFLPPFPGLTTKSLNKYPPNSEATVKGHLDTVRKNLRTTKTVKQQDVDELTEEALQELFDEAFPTPPPDGERTNSVFICIHAQPGQVSSDLTGCLPITSNQGHQYLLIVYDYDSKFIFMEPLKNREGTTIKDA